MHPRPTLVRPEHTVIEVAPLKRGSWRAWVRFKESADGHGFAQLLLDDGVRGAYHRHEAAEDRGRYVAPRASRSTPPTVLLEDSEEQAPESPNL